MADNAPSKIQYDDFIANVQPDPAKPESTIMLSGFIGHGGDGVVRVYPDPSLGTWYDVPETDVVHSMAVPDSKLGGSYVWVRSSAQIKPGAAAAAPAAAAAAPVAQAAPNFTIGAGCTFICAQPGAALQPTPATHCFICPSITQQCMQPTPTADVTLATICTQPNHCLQPTPTAHPTLATVCTQFCPTYHAGCLTLPVNCFPITQPAVCTIAVSPNCPPPPPGTPVQQQQLFAAAAMQPTPSAVNQCGGGMVQPTPSAVHQCGGQTAATVCTQPPACHPSVNVICPTPSAVHQCGPNTQPPACHPSVNMICPTPSAVHQCGGPNTAATVCTQPPACHPSVNMICPTPSAVNQCGPNTQPPACQPSVNMICPTPSAVHQCGVFTPFGR
jgi:hypothetical protein